jgi:hypothetical protein
VLVTVDVSIGMTVMDGVDTEAVVFAIVELLITSLVEISRDEVGPEVDVIEYVGVLSDEFIVVFVI